MQFLTLVLAAASIAYAAPEPEKSPATHKQASCFCQPQKFKGNGGCEAQKLFTLCCSPVQTDLFSQPSMCTVTTKNGQWGYCSGNGRLWCGNFEI